MFHCNTVRLAVNADCYSFSVTFSLPPSRAMTPAEQLDIIRSFEAVESMDDEAVSKRDLEVVKWSADSFSLNGCISVPIFEIQIFAL